MATLLRTFNPFDVGPDMRTDDPAGKQGSAQSSFAMSGLDQNVDSHRNRIKEKIKQLNLAHQRDMSVHQDRNLHASDNSKGIAKLPVWDESRRAMPNEYARSAIFTVRNKKVARRTITNQDVFVVGDSVVRYTGIELRAYDDELVWLEVLNLAKNFPLGEWIQFSVYQICKALGWSKSKFYYKKIHECLLRLKATAVSIENSRLGKGKAIAFIEDYEWEDSSGAKLPKCRVRIHQNMSDLFGGHHFTELEWEAYIGLSPIARRIYDYAASHRIPYSLRLETVGKMCGSDSSNRVRRWREQVNKALEELKSKHLIKGGEVRIGLVFIQRHHRHLRGGKSEKLS